MEYFTLLMLFQLFRSNAFVIQILYKIWSAFEVNFHIHIHLATRLKKSRLIVKDHACLEELVKSGNFLTAGEQIARKNLSLK